jgi:hypothetical protein
LETITDYADFNKRFKEKNIMTATVMCIFISSEIIRNELLEKIVILQSEKPNVENYSWMDLKPIYKNWASDSTKLYGNNSGVIHTILLEDVKNKLIDLKKSNDTDCDFYKRYRKLVDKIDIVTTA